jgi:transketolase
MKILNKDLRRRILEKGNELKHGHYGAALSCLDCIKYLYDHVLDIKNDKFILSKGHGEMALFTVLESRGQSPTWTIHLDYNEKEGIHATTGSLGHGLPIGVGRAFARKIKKEKGHVYVLLGDGEMEEGSNWEALTIAKKLKINNINLLIDWNKYQAVGSVKDVGCLDDKALSKKLRAFGCQTMIINGHDEEDLSKLQYLSKGINAVILDTVKGKGVRVLEENHAHVFYWHEHPREYKTALEDLA